MPEQITKYPDVTLQVLEGAGAQCGTGVKPRILTRCPPERFCSLPTGELCIYGLEEIPKMTQVSTEEVARVVCPPPPPPATSTFSLSGPEVLLFAGAFVAGMVVGGFRTLASKG